MSGVISCLATGGVMCNTAASCVGLVRLPLEARVEAAGWISALVMNG